MDDPLFSPPVRPWARFFAFWFDVTVLFFPFELLWQYLDPATYFDFLSLSFPMAMAKTITAVPLAALCLALTGTTPGKALLGVRVVAADGEKMTFTRAFKRGVYSFWFGALGQIAPVGYLALYLSFRRLNVTRATSWDVKFKTQVTHSPYVPWKVALLVVVSAACIIVQTLWLLEIYPELLSAFGLVPAGTASPT